MMSSTEVFAVVLMVLFCLLVYVFVAECVNQSLCDSRWSYDARVAIAIFWPIGLPIILIVRLLTPVFKWVLRLGKSVGSRIRGGRGERIPEARTITEEADRRLSRYDVSKLGRAWRRPKEKTDR